MFNINGAIFSAVCSFSFAYLFLVVFSFPRMKVVLRREYYDGLYPLFIAFLTESAAGLPFLFAMPFVFRKFYFLIANNINIFLSWNTVLHDWTLPELVSFLGDVSYLHYDRSLCYR